MLILNPFLDNSLLIYKITKDEVEISDENEEDLKSAGQWTYLL